VRAFDRPSQPQTGPLSLVRLEVPGREDAGERREGIADLVVKLIYEYGYSDEVAAAALNQLTCCLRLAATFDPVVDQQHSISGLYGLLLNLKDVARISIVECGYDSMFGTGKQVPLFTNRDEAHPERVRSRASEDEAASLNTADLRHVLRPPGADQFGNNSGKGLTVVKDPPDIGVPLLPRKATEKRTCSRPGTHTNSMLVPHNVAHTEVPIGRTCGAGPRDVRCARSGAPVGWVPQAVKRVPGGCDGSAFDRRWIAPDRTAYPPGP
jgi:hypothetical protein